MSPRTPLEGAVEGARHFNEVRGLYHSALIQISMYSKEPHVLKVVRETLELGDELSQRYWAARYDDSRLAGDE